MAVRKQRRVITLQELETFKQESEQRFQIEEAKRKIAEKLAEDMSGGWAAADGTEAVTIKPEWVYEFDETISESQRQHTKTCNVTLKSSLMGDSFESLVTATMNYRPVAYRGFRWRIVGPLNTSYEIDGYTVRLELHAISKARY